MKSLSKVSGQRFLLTRCSRHSFQLKVGGGVKGCHSSAQMTYNKHSDSVPSGFGWFGMLYCFLLVSLSPSHYAEAQFQPRDADQSFGTGGCVRLPTGIEVLPCHSLPCFPKYSEPRNPPRRRGWVQDKGEEGAQQ